MFFYCGICLVCVEDITAMQISLKILLAKFQWNFEQNLSSKNMLLKSTTKLLVVERIETGPNL
jgi:hypothetical protein